MSITIQIDYRALSRSKLQFEKHDNNKVHMRLHGNPAIRYIGTKFTNSLNETFCQFTVKPGCYSHVLLVSHLAKHKLAFSCF